MNQQSPRGPAAIVAAIRGVPVHEYLWLLATLLLSLALRLPFFNVAMIADEGGYALVTRGWLDGTGQLYGDLWISRPQGIFVVYAAIFETLGTDTVAIRLGAWIACALTTVVVWMIARHWVPAPVALYAAACFAMFSSLPNLEGFAANAEIFMGLPAAISAWLLLRSWELGWGRWHLISTGLAIGLATQLKPSGIVMFPVAVLFVLLIEPTPLAIILQRTGWILGGIAIVGIPSLLHGWYLGWSDFVYATMTYRLTSQSTATTTLQGHFDRMFNLDYRFCALVGVVGVVLILKYREPIRRGYFRLAFAPHPQMPKPSLKRPSRTVHVVPQAAAPLLSLSRPADPVGFLLRLWGVGCFLGIAMGGDWWSHYLIQIVAPFSIWFARATLDILKSLPRPDRVMFASILIGVVLAPYWVVFAGNRDSRSITEALFAHVGYPAQADVAAYLNQHTEPGTPIFVAFDQAAIYYLADRPAAYRHLYAQELEAIPNSYSEILSMIQGPDRPLYIVTTRQADLFPDRGAIFWQLVGEHYQLETEIDGVPIYRAKEIAGQNERLKHVLAAS
jgi:4-amino-4-deoxy-L-arabinose transferase-like glycosyltransferase